MATHLGEQKDGVEKGPEIITQEFIKTDLFHKYFDTEVLTINQPDPDPQYNSGEYKNLKQMPLVVESFSHVYQTIMSLLASEIPVNLLGSDEVAAPIFNAIAKKYGREDVGVVWLDSHPDMNDKTRTISGHIHGMSLALGLGDGHPDLLATRPNNGFQFSDAVLIASGEADIDPLEGEFVREKNMYHITPSDIRARGVEDVVVKTTEYFRNMGKTKLAFHFDIDSIDPHESPGVSVPAHDGNTFEEVYGIAKGLFGNFEIVSFNLAEYNPDHDPDGVTLEYALEILKLLK